MSAAVSTLGWLPVDVREDVLRDEVLIPHHLPRTVVCRGVEVYTPQRDIEQLSEGHNPCNCDLQERSVNAVLRILYPWEQKLITMKFLEEMSPQEIAKETGLSVHRVRRTIRQSCVLLRRKISLEDL